MVIHDTECPYRDQVSQNSNPNPQIRRDHKDSCLEVSFLTFTCFFTVSAETLRNRNENSNLYRLVTAYREHGHRRAAVDPLGLMEREYVVL